MEAPETKSYGPYLRPKANNILSGLDWVMADGIRVAPRVLLSNGGSSLNEDTESLRGVYATP